ncbi:NACHT domain-containing protein [Nonomuraea gerenzanensis]|nr:ATP-binding protein [Nonomuraea gerenzanensis]UBU16437.1 ATP-binding protein [Nonomuraea gerenzanensis]
MLAEEPLPSWAGGHRVVAIGGQTERPVDDVGIITDVDGCVTVQAKKAMDLAKAASSAMAEALEQVVDIATIGVPDSPSRLDQLRPLDPARDRVLILTDDAAPKTVNEMLAPVIDRLRDLPATVPITEVYRNKGEEKAFKLLEAHLGRVWTGRHGVQMGEQDLRALGRVLGVYAVHLVDGGSHAAAARELIKGIAPDAGDVSRIWDRLELEARRLAEDRTYLDRSGLVRRLEEEGVYLLPVARLRPDIARLRSRSAGNLATIFGALTIHAPEGPVSLPRTVLPAVLAADGNLAIIGEPGAGKTVILHALATQCQARGMDVVVLRANDLGATRGQTRSELGVTHDLDDVLVGWPGSGSGVVVIDGLDQARGADPSVWMAELVKSLSGTRWRVVATIRSYDLRHGHRWRRMFAGAPIEQQQSDSAFSNVRHIVVQNLSQAELAPLQSSSPRLWHLIEGAEPRLADLLANPFNLDVAGELLSDGLTTDLLAVRSQVDLLHAYWERRVNDEPSGRVDRTRALGSIVGRMVAQGRQTLNLTDLPATASSSAVEALTSSGVLRDAPATAGHAATPIEFAHPVLFDYAVAMLALGDTNRPDSLADVLDGSPNLAITVRPSLHYRLATVWKDDASRDVFWKLALRLASRSEGHPLAVLAAGRVAVLEVEQPSDFEPLGAACTAATGDSNGRWTVVDAHEMAFLVAATGASAPEAAFAGLTVMSAKLAQETRSADDVGLALLAVQLPLRAFNDDLGMVQRHLGELADVVVASMSVASADRSDPSRAQLAKLSGRLLSLVAVADPSPVAAIIVEACQPTAIYAWGVSHLRPLIEKLPEIVRLDPELAVALAASVWEFQETRDEPTPVLDSLILGMSSNRRQDLDGARYQVGSKFPAILQADLAAATRILIRAAETEQRYPPNPLTDYTATPRPLLGDSLQFSAGHQVLLPMVQAWTEQLVQTADAAEDAARDAAGAVLGERLSQVVAHVIQNLRHAEVWQHLLLRASLAQRPSLARALFPALLSPNLFDHPTTRHQAAQVALRLSPLLNGPEHAQLEEAILQIAAPHPSNDGWEGTTDILDAACTRIIGSFSEQNLQTVEAQARWLTASQDPGFEGVPAPDESQFDSIEAVWDSPSPEPGTVAYYRDAVLQAAERIRSKDPAERADAETQLINLWALLKPAVSPEGRERSEGDEDSLYDLALRTAEQLATVPQCAPATTLGSEIFGALLGALPSASAPALVDDVSGTWHVRPAPGWSMTATMSALQGLVYLIGRTDWRDAHREDLTAALSPFLDSSNPAYRFVSLKALVVIYEQPAELLTELGRRLVQESDQHVSAYLLRHLSTLTHKFPQDVDRLLRDLANHPSWLVLTPDPAGDKVELRDSRSTQAVHLLSALATIHATAHAETVVCTWWSNPCDHPNRVTQSMRSWRSLLNPDDEVLRGAQRQAFRIINLGLNKLGETWVQRGSAGQPPHTMAWERGARSARIAEEIAQQLYFASEATQSSPLEQPASGKDFRKFCSYAMPILDALTNVQHPAVTHHIVQLADVLCSYEPHAAVLTAEKAVVGDRGYAREALGLDATLSLARRYLTDHRDLLRTDVLCLTAIRALLEVFVRVGWDQALRLSEDLDELFR